MQKLIIIGVLFIFSTNAFAKSTCKELEKNLKNYESACSLSTDLTAGCGTMAALAVAFFGPVGFACSVPSIVASGVCALRDMKKRWLDKCQTGEELESWQHVSVKMKDKSEAAIHIRHQKMIENNAIFETAVDTFVTEAYREGLDVSLPENERWFHDAVEHFEMDYIERAKEIDREFQANI